MFVRCWRLPAAHRTLVGAGRKNKMELQPGYLAVLRLATSRLLDSASGSEARRTNQHI